MTPTPTQIAEWRKGFLKLKKLPIDLVGSFAAIGMSQEFQAYCDGRTEQAAEIAELKAKLEHLKQVIIQDRIEWDDFPPTSQLAFADLLKD